MKISRMIGYCFGGGILRKWRLADIRKERLEARRARLQALERKKLSIIKAVHGYPKLEMTQEQFDKLPKGSDIDLNNCPLNTWLVCSVPEYITDVIVVGQLVGSMDLLDSQWGGYAFNLPEKQINRYRLVIVPTLAVA